MGERRCRLDITAEETQLAGMASNPLFGFHINHYDCRYERLTRCAMTLDSFFCQGALAQMEYRIERHRDRKSTRLNSSHSQISYAVFCLKKKKKLDIIH